jgi:hypothetical protein
MCSTFSAGGAFLIRRPRGGKPAATRASKRLVEPDSWCSFIGHPRSAKLDGRRPTGEGCGGYCSHDQLVSRRSLARSAVLLCLGSSLIALQLRGGTIQQFGVNVLQQQQTAAALFPSAPHVQLPNTRVSAQSGVEKPAPHRRVRTQPARQWGTYPNRRLWRRFVVLGYSNRRWK